MQPFLEILADEILKNYGSNLSDICIVFPSRRAGVFFRNILAKKISKPLLSPTIEGIQDLIAELSPYTIADKLTQIFELYESYISSSQEESFDSFYPWGEMLLDDFDDIDRNLVNSQHLFRILKEHKEIEEQFGFTPAESEDFLKFWNTFSNRELTEQQKEFIETWQIMSKVYLDFRKRLTDKNICYEGMAYRKIFESLKEGVLNINYDKIIFAGFNMLNKAEESILKLLLESGKAEIFWDADEYYVNNELMEAGKFLRGNFINLSDSKPKWIDNNFANNKKNINLIGAALQSGQAKAVGYLLENSIGEPANSAIILPDESMLLPVLHSIPENVKALNITMGYPFKSSLLYNFIKALYSLQKNKKSKGESTVYYQKDCSEILSSPYLKLIDPGGCFRVINEIITKNVIYLSAGRIQKISGSTEAIFGKIFQSINSCNEIIPYLLDNLSIISSAFEDKSPQSFRFEKEFVFALFSELNRLNDLTANLETQLEPETLWNLLIELLDRIKIPFTGEPVKGLQIMGLLETRSLDFENIYILSMNEGTVPHQRSGGSYIPYHLRKAFRMPTYEDDDAAFAYYFYRLIQRAKNIYLIYNTETTGLISGEKSRFVLQVEKELIRFNKDIKLNEFIFQPGIDKPDNKEITIFKSSEMLESFSNIVFSASSISDYIQCTLKFYLSRIAGLKKEESVEEAFSGAAFGSVLHEIMKQLYENSTNSMIAEQDIGLFKKQIENEYDTIWANACNKIPELKEFAEVVYGRNLLFKNVIKKLVNLILENDFLQVPFKIIETEKKLTGELNINSVDLNINLKLTGRLDRVEEKDEITRIIDYKTGTFSPKKPGKRTIADYFDNVFSDPEYRESFQQYFYAMLYKNVNPKASLNIGIYPLRSAGKGVEFLEDSYISNETIDGFKKGLSRLFAEMFDSSIPFEKTDDIDRCKYCDFKSLCYRE